MIRINQDKRFLMVLGGLKFISVSLITFKTGHFRRTPYLACGDFFGIDVRGLNNCCF